MAKKLNELIDQVNNSNFATIRGIISGIFDILNNNKSSVNDLEKVIRLDPPLASKVLKVANSAFYASRVDFSDLKEAVLWIGFDEINNIAITEQFFKVFNSESHNNFSRKGLWKNSIATALLGKMIYRREYGEKGENLYTAGLIHNIGIIIIDQFLNDDFEKILTICEENDRIQMEVEKEILGFAHTDVANELAKGWNFPENLKIMLQYHHNPDDVPIEYKKKTETLFIADYFCKELKLGYSDHSHFDENKKFKEYLQNNCIEKESLELLIPDLMEQIKHLENIGLLSNGN